MIKFEDIRPGSLLKYRSNCSDLEGTYLFVRKQGTTWICNIQEVFDDGQKYVCENHQLFSTVNFLDRINNRYELIFFIP